MALRIEDAAGNQHIPQGLHAAPLTREERVAIEARQNDAAIPKARIRTSPQRPATDTLERLYFDLARKFTPRENCLLLFALGRLTIDELRAEFDQ